MDEKSCQTDDRKSRMKKLWIKNTAEDKIAMLQQAESVHTGINQSAIEKDWWVTVTLFALSKCSCVPYLTFKGGTSLSKGFNLIDRFSEDIDLAIHHSFFGVESTTKSQKEKLRKASRAYVQNTLSKQLDDALREMGVTGYRIENVTYIQTQDGTSKLIDSDKDPTVIHLLYDSVVQDVITYIPPRVKIEVSCLSMDEPTEERNIHSLISEVFSEEDEIGIGFRTVLPTRTFLEKIFLLAEEFQKDNPRCLRMSRHLYDLERLMDSTYGLEALRNRQLYDTIVEHRRTYYALKYVDYNQHAPRFIKIIPPQSVIQDWAEDYANMQEHFIYGGSLPFKRLIERIEELQARIRKME